MLHGVVTAALHVEGRGPWQLRDAAALALAGAPRWAAGPARWAPFARIPGLQLEAPHCLNWRGRALTQENDGARARHPNAPPCPGWVWHRRAHWYWRSRIRRHVRAQPHRERQAGAQRICLALPGKRARTAHGGYGCRSAAHSASQSGCPRIIRLTAGPSPRRPRQPHFRRLTAGRFNTHQFGTTRLPRRRPLGRAQRGFPPASSWAYSAEWPAPSRRDGRRGQRFQVGRACRPGQKALLRLRGTSSLALCVRSPGVCAPPTLRLPRRPAAMAAAICDELGAEDPHLHLLRHKQLALVGHWRAGELLVSERQHLLHSHILMRRSARDGKLLSHHLERPPHLQHGDRLRRAVPRGLGQPRRTICVGPRPVVCVVTLQHLPRTSGQRRRDAPTAGPRISAGAAPGRGCGSLLRVGAGRRRSAEGQRLAGG
eukprot:scaffold10023_cov88-Isochrysis_galbana.AAC.1